MSSLRNLLVGALSALLLIGGAAAPTDEAPPPSGRLQREFTASSDLRAFVRDAMHRPKEGGIFYARYAAKLCARDFPAISRAAIGGMSGQVGKHSGGSSRIKLIAGLGQRCSAFSVGEAGGMRRSLETRARVGDDPLIAAERQFVAAWRSAKPDIMRAAVSRLVQLDDPMLWTEHRFNRYVARFDSDADRMSGIFLNGKVYTNRDAQKWLEASIALDLGFCKPDVACALDDELQVGCALGGSCASDREESAKQYLLANGGTEKNWANVLSLVSQMQGALASRNVTFFMR